MLKKIRVHVTQGICPRLCVYSHLCVSMWSKTTNEPGAFISPPKDIISNSYTYFLSPDSGNVSANSSHTPPASAWLYGVNDIL